MTNVRYYSRDSLVAHGLRSDQWHADHEVYAIDLDAILPIRPEPSRERRYEHCERTWINAYAELQALRPDARPDDAVAAEIVRLRAENERMRAVVEAAANICVGRWDGTECLVSPPCGNCDPCTLRNAVDAYRAVQPTHPTHADGSPVLPHFAPVTPATLTPPEWSALFELRRFCNSESGAIVRNAELLSAIDKLTLVAASAKGKRPGVAEPPNCSACMSTPEHAEERMRTLVAHPSLISSGAPDATQRALHDID